MNLDNVTLVTMETMYHDLAKRAMEETLARLPFKNVLVLSDQDFLPGSTFVKIEHGNMEQYCNILLKQLSQHINTSHMIFQQWDAMVHDGSQWTDEFLEYDYIGAPWPWRPEGQNVGNGGFSLRSKKLLDALQAPHIQMNLSGIHGVQEDNYICIEYRQELEARGIRYAPTDLANRFSMELHPYDGYSMAHHGFWNIVRFMPKETVEYFITRAPKNTWNEPHRAHHTILMMSYAGYYDLLETQVDLIKASPAYDQIKQMLWTHAFPTAHIMRLLIE